jgi:ribosomal-protein-alanine N-acetyltransferase
MFQLGFQDFPEGNPDEGGDIRMAMKVQPTLETEHLFLRPFDLSDAKRVQALAGDKDVASTTLAIPHPYGNGMAEDWIRTHRGAFEKGELVNFAIVLRSTGELIGAIGLTLSQEHVRAELGYWVGKPYWDQGYCTEAAREIIRYAFGSLALNRVQAMHLSRNPASGKVMRKIGMKHEGRRRQYILKWGFFEDVELYSLLRSEYGDP